MMVDVTTVGIILSAVGIGAAIIYNAFRTHQNTKTRYYTILKDMYTRSEQIDNINEEEDPKKYFTGLANFAFFMCDLIDEGIIPKRMLTEKFNSVFSETLWIIQNIVKKKPEFKVFIKFCDDDNIKQKMPSRKRLKGRIIGSDIHSLIFGYSADKDADIYVCRKCGHMSGTKDKFLSHEKEKHSVNNNSKT